MANKAVLMLLAITITTLAFAGNDEDVNVILVSKKGLAAKDKITEYYHPDGIQLITGGIYHFVIAGKKLNYHRIVRIWNDSLSVAWTVDSFPQRQFAIKEIDRIIFPSLDNGRVGWPNPTLSSDNCDFTMIKNPDVESPKSSICLNEDCTEFTTGYKFMTSGYGWKTIYRDGDKVFMIDGRFLAELRGKKRTK